MRPGLFESISRVEYWPPAPPSIAPDGSRKASPVADIFEHWIVAEIESIHALSIIPIRNPKHPATGRTAIQVQVDVYGVAAGTQLDFDRRLSALAADRYFDEDYESAGLLSAVAAEAMLNRFMRVHAIPIPSRASLMKKYNAILSWCRRQGRTDLLKVLHILRADFDEKLAKPRNAFGYGEPAWQVDPLRLALAAVRTNVGLAAELERTISETTVAAAH